ncbi:MAG: hypothetical protein F6K48_03070 [Okeania sp. SIO3H1]|nr:hypothetical protein [Okeania sp. SIO3H1]
MTPFKKSYEQAAVLICHLDNCFKVWMGDPDLWHGIYFSKNGNYNKHPADQWYAVSAALRRSKKFTLSGHIQAPGFSTGREMWHPVFKLKEEYRCPMPTDEEIIKLLLQTYKAPFKPYGSLYIKSDNHVTVADVMEEDNPIRVRGWGHLQYLPRGEDIQDAMNDVLQTGVKMLNLTVDTDSTLVLYKMCQFLNETFAVWDAQYES